MTSFLFLIICRNIDKSNFFPIVGISIVGISESQRLNVVATSASGVRFYFTATGNNPVSLEQNREGGGGIQHSCKSKFFGTNWDLKSGLVWVLNDRKRLVSKGSGRPAIWNPYHFVKNYLKSRQKCLDFEWCVFQMVEHQLISNPLKRDHLKSYLQKVWISKVGFLIPTVNTFGQSQQITLKSQTNTI